MGLLDNPKNIDLAASSSTAKEQQDYKAGKEIALRKDPTPANEQESAALAYYQKVQQAMTDAGMDKKQRDITEDEIAHGGKTLISRLAELDKPSTLGLGLDGGHTRQDMMSTIENMTPADYKLLQDPAYKRDLLASTWNYETNEDVNRRMAQMIEAKAAAPNFEASQGVKRTLWEVYRDTQNGGATDKNLASAIASMSPADAAMYKSDADYRKRIDDIVANTLGDSARDLAKPVLEQVAKTGKPPELSTLQQIQKNTMDGVNPRQQIDLVEKLLADPKVREGLAKKWPDQTPEEQKMYSAIQDAIPTFGHAVGSNDNTLLSTGHFSMYDKLRMQVPLNQLYSDMARLPEQQRSEFANMLRPQEKEILDKVVAQGGEERLEDRMRAIIVSGGSYKDIQGELAKLTTDEQKKALLNSYQNKYNSNLSNDYMPLVDDADKVQFQNYLKPNGDGNQTAFEHAKTTDGLTRFSFDASGQTVERALQIEKGMLTEFQALHKQLPKEMQEKINKLITDAVEQNRAAPIEEIKALGHAALDVAAVVATVYTLGGSAALAATIRAGEAATTLITRAAAERTAAAVLERQVVAPVADAVVDTAATRIAGGAVADPLVATDRAAAAIQPTTSEIGAAEKVAAEKVAAEKVAAEKAAAEKVAAEKAAAEKVAAEKAAAEKAAAEKAAAEKAAAEKAAAEKAAAEKAATEKAAAEKAAAEKSAAEKAAAEKAAAEKAAAEKAAAEKAAAEKAAAEKAAAEKAAAEKATAEKAAAEKAAAEKAAAEKAAAEKAAAEKAAAEESRCRKGCRREGRR